MVTFSLVCGRIKIERTGYREGGETLMRIAVQFDEGGECVLVDENENVWPPWQVRRQALEETFFGSV